MLKIINETYSKLEDIFEDISESTDHKREDQQLYNVNTQLESLSKKNDESRLMFSEFKEKENTKKNISLLKKIICNGDLLDKYIKFTESDFGSALDDHIALFQNLPDLWSNIVRLEYETQNKKLLIEKMQRIRDIANSLATIPEESSDPESIVKMRNEIVKNVVQIQKDIISILKNDEPLLEHKLNKYLTDIQNSQEEKLKNLVRVVLRTFYMIIKKSSIRIDLNRAATLLRNKANYEGNQVQEFLLIIKDINKEIFEIAAEDNEVILIKDDRTLELKMNNTFGISDLASSLTRFRNVFQFQKDFTKIFEDNIEEENYRTGLRNEAHENWNGLRDLFAKSLFPFAKEYSAELISEVAKIESEFEIDLTEFREDCQNFNIVDSYNKINMNLLNMKDEVFDCIKLAADGEDTYEDFYMKWKRFSESISRLSTNYQNAKILRIQSKNLETMRVLLMLFICSNKIMEEKIRKRKYAILNHYVSTLKMLQDPIKPIIKDENIEDLQLIEKRKELISIFNLLNNYEIDTWIDIKNSSPEKK